MTKGRARRVAKGAREEERGQSGQSEEDSANESPTTKVTMTGDDKENERPKTPPMPEAPGSDTPTVSLRGKEEEQFWECEEGEEEDPKEFYLQARVSGYLKDTDAPQYLEWHKRRQNEKQKLKKARQR